MKFDIIVHFYEMLKEMTVSENFFCWSQPWSCSSFHTERTMKLQTRYSLKRRKQNIISKIKILLNRCISSLVILYSIKKLFWRISFILLYIYIFLVVGNGAILLYVPVYTNLLLYLVVSLQIIVIYQVDSGEPRS